MDVKSSKPQVVLTIAGFDPSSGAGITADLTTFRSHGCFGIACITALTVQNTQVVAKYQSIEPNLVTDTLESLQSDFQISAVKIGMLGTREITERVIDFLSHNRSGPIVLDPVLVSSSGKNLLDEQGITMMKQKLLPLVDVITPNLLETELLTGRKLTADMDWYSAAKDLKSMGAGNVVITGGHRSDNSDFVLLGDHTEEWITGERIDSTSTHGTGCVFSSSIACNLLKNHDLVECVSRAKKFIYEAIIQAPDLGHGLGPMYQ